ncbi:hypothetical protein Tcan_00563, partial [Toxocara canis]
MHKYIERISRFEFSTTSEEKALRNAYSARENIVNLTLEERCLFGFNVARILIFFSRTLYNNSPKSLPVLLLPTCFCLNVREKITRKDAAHYEKTYSSPSQ